MNHGFPPFKLLPWLILCCLNAFSSAARSKNCIGELGAVPGIPSGFTLGGQGSGNRVVFPDASGTVFYGSRTGLLHIHKNYNQSIARGLIISFHDRGESGMQQEALFKLSDPAINPDMLVIYPDGIENEWQGDPAATTDDLTLAVNAITYAKSNFCIDTERIYATGMGNGGGFGNNILACDPASKQLAAVAGVSGAYYSQKSYRDKLECMPSLQRFIANWAGWNCASGTIQLSSLFNGSVTKTAFGAGDAAGLTTHYKIDGMASSWPSVANGNYLDAAPVIMDFFNSVVDAVWQGRRSQPCIELDFIEHLLQKHQLDEDWLFDYVSSPNIFELRKQRCHNLDQDQLREHFNVFEFRKYIDHSIVQDHLPDHYVLKIQLQLLLFSTGSNRHLPHRRWPKLHFQR
ncbi:hypothetical protein B0A48_06383 [Cryoendolithus antarcticus]|uniref:feruloyl esterase n=1 Tax=Cryoendolithus antarcticus TaxID=1507870 RepID=A0A1V8TAS9_9PEZI|nr:hypothetical protein B0A48_06383 [Cryoendolithus antarcticus]